MSSVRKTGKTIRLLLSFVPFVVFCPFAFAVSVDFDVQPRVLAMDESATATITVSGLSDAPTPDLPAINGFQVTSTSNQRSFQFGTGGQNSTITFSYILAPQAVGTFTIGPFAYQANGQRFSLSPVQVQVTAPGSAANGASSPQQWSDLIFAKVATERATIYNQESFDITLSIYFRNLNLGRDVSLLNMPANGLSLQQFQDAGQSREVINNQIFNVMKFRTKATALTAGTFKLDPTLRVSVLIQNQHRRNDFPGFLGDMFNQVEARPLDVTAEPLEIEVKPLPVEGKPANFSGAVGTFTCDVQVKPTDLNVGDPITVTTTISGHGNLATVPAPSIHVGDDFKTYEPRLVSKDIDENRSEGRISFEQVLIPKTKDIAALPPVSFAYFDPAKGAYQSLTRGPFPLVLHQGSNTSAMLVQGNVVHDEATTKILGTDILYLKPAPSKWSPADGLAEFTTPLFFGMQVAPPLLLAALFFIARRREELAGDISKARREMAPRSARAALARAEAAIAANDSASFFNALWDAMASYFGNRLNLPPGDVTYDVVLARLQSGGLPDGSIQWLKSVMELCDQARFGLGQTTAPDRALVRELGQILRACEKIRL